MSSGSPSCETLSAVRRKLARAAALLDAREADVDAFASACEQRVLAAEQSLIRAREERDVLRVEATVAREAQEATEAENARLRSALESREAEWAQSQEGQQSLVAHTLGDVRDTLELASARVAAAEAERRELRREVLSMQREVEALKRDKGAQEAALSKERQRRRTARAKWREATKRIGAGVEVLQQENQAAAEALAETQRDRDAALRTLEELSAAAASERQRRLRLEAGLDEMRTVRVAERERLAGLEQQRARALEQRLELETELCQRLFQEPTGEEESRELDESSRTLQEAAEARPRAEQNGPWEARPEDDESFESASDTENEERDELPGLATSPLRAVVRKLRRLEAENVDDADRDEIAGDALRERMRNATTSLMSALGPRAGHA